MIHQIPTRLEFKFKIYPFFSLILVIIVHQVILQTAT